MKTISINVYSLDELATEAKKNAIEHHRYINTDNNYWYDFLFDDFSAICEAVGVHIKKGAIYFSGFYSQGDGSKFEATIDLLAFIEGMAAEAWKSYAPNVSFPVKPLHLDSRIKALFANGLIDSNCEVKRPLQGYWVNVDADFDYSYNQCKNYQCIDSYLAQLKKWLTDAVESLNHYLYKSLEDTYDGLTSDTMIADTLMAEDYEFTNDGVCADRISRLTAAISD